MTVYNKDPDYVYRWVNAKHEDGSRIMKFKRGGYEFARSETDAGEYVIGQESVYHSDQHGSIVRIPVGNDTHAYLMRIKKEWYDEDQEAKERELRELEEQIHRTGTSSGEDFGQYGEVKLSRKALNEL
jgi:hypothetical protein